MNKEDKIRQEEATGKWEKMKDSLLISEIYPNVIKISLNLKFDYPNAFKHNEKKITLNFKPTEKAYFEINCINKDCIFSDLVLDIEIRNTINQKLDSYKGHKMCNGFNTFSCYERRSGTCTASLDYEIKIKYKNNI